MDIARAFSYPFKDVAWLKKVLIGGLLVLSVIGIPAVIGYTMRIMRNVVAGTDTPLPEWSDIGELWVEGIKAIPVYIFWFIPTIILGAVTSGDQSISLTCISWIVSTLCAVLAAIGVMRVATSGRFGDGFQVSAVINHLTSNFGDYLIVFLMIYVLSVVAAIGVIACVIGVFATIAYAAFVQSHLWAQAYRRSQGGGELPAAPRF